jgi:hypothetical protein
MGSLIEKFISNIEKRFINLEKTIKKLISESIAIQKLGIKIFDNQDAYQDFIMSRIISFINKNIFIAIRESDLNKRFYLNSKFFCESFGIECKEFYSMLNIKLAISFNFMDRDANLMNTQKNILHKEEKINVSI